MGVGSATGGSLLDSYQAEQQILRAHPLNVLIEGAVTETDAVVRLLEPLLRAPLVAHSSLPPLRLPRETEQSLILRDVATLSGHNQRRLLAWMDGSGLRTQVISTTTVPLFPLVVNGLFDATLYYRLNVILLRLGVRGAE